MATRNKGIKRAPQRWQDTRDDAPDVALVFDARSADRLIADMASTPLTGSGKQLLVLTMDTPDSDAEARTMAPDAVRLCAALAAVADGELEDEVDGILDAFKEETGR
jgi:RNA polymerase II subunit A C-terminal domain phosphatase SSU72